MVENQRITLTSNWGTLGDADLLSALMRNTTDDIDINLDDMAADNCVCLVRTDRNEKSKAQLELKAHGCIKSIILMSEALVIEVFGVSDEYLLTHTSEFFDDWEELAVYYSKITLPNIPVCKLKFTRTRNEDRVWIYGVKIHMQSKTNHYPEIPVKFNFEQISRLMGNSNFNNISRSINFKNPLTSNLHYLLARKPVHNDISTHSSSNKNCKENDEEVEAEFLTRLKVKAPHSAEFQKLCSKQLSNESYGSNWLTLYIDKKFNEIKSDILHEVDAKINFLKDETNQKLDKIISLLEERAVIQ